MTEQLSTACVRTHTHTHTHRGFSGSLYTHIYMYICIYIGFPGSSAGKESALNAGDSSLIPALGRSPGGGHGNRLQCS